MQPSQKRSVDLINLITKDIVIFLTKHSDDYEISNYIDDEPVTDTLEDTTKVLEYFVNENPDKDPPSNEIIPV